MTGLFDWNFLYHKRFKTQEEYIAYQMGLREARTRAGYVYPIKQRFPRRPRVRRRLMNPAQRY